MAARVGMIWAEARGGAIGRGGEMPWHVPEDLAHFKRATVNAPVIMGRRTWESLPEQFRPLPGRSNIVVTRNHDYVVAGARIAPSLDEALVMTESAAQVWIIGGGQLYTAAMPVADELVVTRLDLEIPDADTFAPEIGPEWELTQPGTPEVSSTGIAYRFERWQRPVPDSA